MGEQRVQAANALLLLGHSPGSDQELERAREFQEPVFFSLDQIPDAHE
jgi:hypothetical protein